MDDKEKRSKRIATEEKFKKKKRLEIERKEIWKNRSNDHGEFRALGEDLEHIQNGYYWTNPIGRRNKRSKLYFHGFTSLHKDKPKRAEQMTLEHIINEGLDELNG